MMMNDKDLKRNGSGYVDEPCYKAVTAPPRPGEIWIHSKSGAQMLVLANVNGVCPTLRLAAMGGEGYISVMSKTPMHVKPYMIDYCFDNLLTEFVKVVKSEEMNAVRKSVARALGLVDALNPIFEIDQGSHPYILEEKVKVLEEQVKTLTIERDKARQIAKEIKIDLDTKNMADKMVNDSIADMEQENMKLRIYKNMYMDIIDKLVSMRGGAAVNE